MAHIQPLEVYVQYIVICKLSDYLNKNIYSSNHKALTPLYLYHRGIMTHHSSFSPEVDSTHVTIKVQLFSHHGFKIHFHR